MRIQDNHGFVTLLAILIVGSVGFVIVGSLSLLAMDRARTSFVLQESFQAKALADACEEEALQQINDSTSFSGSGSLTLGDGECDYTVTALTGQNRTIEVSGEIGTVIRKNDLSLDAITPNINITSWLEVSDF